MSDLTVAELARRYGVARSTVSRALARAASQRQAGTQPGAPVAPDPVNPGEPQPRYPVQAMDAWWPHRPGRGRPRQPHEGSTQ